MSRKNSAVVTCCLVGLMFLVPHPVTILGLVGWVIYDAWRTAPGDE